MAETQEELNLPIGTIEAEKLKPAKVRIESVSVEEVGTKGSKKVVCKCKHPQSPDNIEISGVKLERNGKLINTGLWVNKDKEGKLRKDSSLVYFLTYTNSTVIKELVGKEVDTVMDDNNYLTFKAY